MTYKTFQDGEILPAADVQLLMDQSIIHVPDIDATEAIPTPGNGTVIYRQDLGVHLRRIGGDWLPLGDLYAANDAQRDGFYDGIPPQGAEVIRTDKGWTERYYAPYSPTNPGGATPEGWYPVSGAFPSFEAWNSAAQPVAAGDIAITLTTPGVLTGGFELIGSAAKIPVTGRYRLAGYYYIWTTTGTFRNITAHRGSKRLAAHTQSTPWTIGYLVRDFDATAGDLITLKAGGDGAVTIQASTKANDESPMLAISYIGPRLGPGA